MKLQKFLILNREDLIPNFSNVDTNDLKPFHFKIDSYNKIKTVPITLYRLEDGTHITIANRFLMKSSSVKNR